ncbi:uncharacterized protein [Temnothorax longispinosus]|uniref:uncharacterized protein n=1 Tax=Temnothorax longispinosus TaxID=300112 RepID=UPI003A9A29D3
MSMFNLSSNFQGKPKGKQKEKGCRLFHAKDFQSLMYPCFMLCRILGIFPYKINASTFEISKPYYILWAVVTCACGIHALICLYNSPIFGKYDEYDKIDMKSLPRALGNYCALVFGGFIITVTLVLSGPRMRLLQIILKISSRLPAESYQKLSKLIHTKDIIGFLYLVAMMLVYMYTLKMNAFFHMYIVLVIFQMDMLYMNCVCVLKICFKRINDNLIYMRELMTIDDPRGFRPIYHEQRNPFLIMELKTLKKQHLTITDTVQMLNMIFSLQLLATIVITFFDLTVYLYYYIFNWQYILLMSASDETLPRIFYFSPIVYNIIKISLVVWACETGKNQALQITTSIHDILNNITDEQIKGELHLFSLQTLHCENTFSAKGFIVDAKLLAAVVGNIVTYVLILYQFKRMSYSCERKANNMEVI